MSNRLCRSLDRMTHLLHQRWTSSHLRTSPLKGRTILNHGWIHGRGFYMAQRDSPVV